MRACVWRVAECVEGSGFDLLSYYYGIFLEVLRRDPQTLLQYTEFPVANGAEEFCVIKRVARFWTGPFGKVCAGSRLHSIE